MNDLEPLFTAEPCGGAVGLGVNLVFALAAAYLAIIIGRRVLGRKNLDASTALAMLTDALSLCHSEDMRTLEVFARSDRSRCTRTRTRGLKSLEPDRIAMYENVGTLILESRKPLKWIRP